MSIFAELKRRNVYRVAALYVIVSWVLLQVADVLLGMLPLPPWIGTLVFFLLALGFPVALLLAWAFELTPEGVRRESATGGEVRKTGSSFGYRDLLIGAAFVAVLAYAFYAHYRSGVDEDAAAAASGYSIVVLPLNDLTNDPTEAYFVEGMHEALITEFSKIEALRVISRTSAAAYRDSAKPVPQIARELNVNAVLEGSVLRVGDTVRVSAQLIDGATDRHLWAGNYDRRMTDILALFGDIAQEIAQQVRVTVTPDEQARLVNTRSIDPQVYERYLKGRHLCDKWSPQEMSQGAGLLREVTALDPDYAPGYAALASCLQYQAFFDYVAPLEIRAESEAAALQAVALDEELADARVALSGILWYLDLNPDAAERELERALQLNPGSDRALLHGSWLLGETGHFDEAIPLTHKAIRLNPLATSTHHALGQVYYLAREFDQSIEAYGEALELNRNDPYLHFSLAVPLHFKGEQAAAFEAARKAVELSSGEPLYVAGLAWLSGTNGFDAEAEQLLRELEADPRASAFHFALVHLGLGNHQQAIDLMLQAYVERSSHLVYIKEGAMFDPLRRDQRFKHLVTRIWGSAPGAE